MKLIECPRDAIQGLPHFVPTSVKINYLNALLKVGFHTLDFGSFVSPKVIPQMRDTAEVLAGLDLSTTSTHLLAIVASVSGAKIAMRYPEIRYLGFPLSVSETFQLRNTNKTIAQAIEVVKEIQNMCLQHHKELVIYFSMGFGNHYGDPYDENILGEMTFKMNAIGIKTIALADTIGISNPENIRRAFQTLIPAFPHIEFGAHLHSHPRTAMRKIAAAWQAGCRRFDGALRGFGGCPIAKDELTGNIATEAMIEYFERENIPTGINTQALSQALQLSVEVFDSQLPNYPV
ncbi:MAG: hydroxymethylglutaryl-CoA lyase [Cytophagales bacterium]|nr:hydroxymethylglutaryl-CoA lyase [Bernardetiaceae bacterium]MDW8209832.1 hydroxymethylglutaryl-CoA lyase [Cytophagales bacterium]